MCTKLQKKRENWLLLLRSIPEFKITYKANRYIMEIL